MSTRLMSTQTHATDTTPAPMDAPSTNWPVGLMDKASASGAGDSRFESWAGHCHSVVNALRPGLSAAHHHTPPLPPCMHAEGKKAGSTRGCSQAVPHPSTNRALCRLTSEVERDPVHSTRYGRQRITQFRPPCLAHSTQRNRITHPERCHQQSWQHPRVFPGGPPPQY